MVVSFQCDVIPEALRRKAEDQAADWPQYVEEEPEIYEQETLDKFFSACGESERLWFEFFQMTGMREQEVIHATDKCSDFSNCTVSVKHNPEYGWTPKAYKERAIPVPKALMSKLKAMLGSAAKAAFRYISSA